MLLRDLFFHRDDSLTSKRSIKQAEQLNTYEPRREKNLFSHNAGI